MNDAITLENVTNYIYYDNDLADEFDFSESFEDIEVGYRLEDYGITSDNIYLSLGFFSICLVGMLLLFAFFLVAKLASRRFPVCKKVTTML